VTRVGRLHPCSHLRLLHRERGLHSTRQPSHTPR
jgi:hypothetical protein